MNNKNILISGAGIAGLTLAYWLKKYGFNPTVVEQSPKLREGGYAIDFWGAGFEVAEKMGIVPALNDADLGISEVAFVDENSKRKGAMNYLQLKKLMNHHAFTLLRSDLSRSIYDVLDKDIEFIFGDTIKAIEQHEESVNVVFNSNNARSFDLVLGADGLHSSVRKLAFGEETQFEKYYGYYTSSYSINARVAGDRAFQLYNIPCKQAALYSTTENKMAAFFIFTAGQKLVYDHHDVERQKEILREEFKGAGWKCAELLAALDAAPDFYFDVVSQIQMSHWSEGRVSLVGDAGYCPSLLSGQGSTLAMVGAYILAGELKAAQGNYKTAFENYENVFKPFIERKQKVAQTFAKSLVPKSNFGIWLRNTFTNLMFLPFVSKLFIKQFMSDGLILKNY